MKETEDVRLIETYNGTKIFFAHSTGKFGCVMPDQSGDYWVGTIKYLKKKIDNCKVEQLVESNFIGTRVYVSNAHCPDNNGRWAILTGKTVGEYKKTKRPKNRRWQPKYKVTFPTFEVEFESDSRRDWYCPDRMWQPDEKDLSEVANLRDQIESTYDTIEEIEDRVRKTQFTKSLKVKIVESSKS